MLLPLLTVVVLTAAVLPIAPQTPATPAAQTPAAVTLPDTPAGRGLQEFVTSFNAGGDKRKAWLSDRTTLPADATAGILTQDAAFLSQHGPVKVVRVAEAAASRIAAVIRHEKSGAHGYLTIDVEAAAPHKVSNFQLRAATPEEISGK